MFRKISLMSCILALGLGSCLGHSQAGVLAVEHAQLPPLPSMFPNIDRQPSAMDFGRGAMSTLPTYNPESTEVWQVDLRSYDLSALDLQDGLGNLIYADFDSRTKWPPLDKMPSDYDPEEIMTLGKNPGLGIRSLQEKGITGWGVGIAIIDQPLLVNHQEYSGQLRFYEEINIGSYWEASMHAPGVASIAVGKTVGVAPDADLYLISGPIASFKNGATEYDFTIPARAIRRILEVNATLPESRKIRVISMSFGWVSGLKGYDEIVSAVNEAKAAGIFVVSSSLEETYTDMKFNGLGRDPLADPDQFTSYEPGIFWANYYYDGTSEQKSLVSGRLLIPMDSRTTASPTGNSDYAFYREGGWSWSIPYIAGMYALACQVDPSITPERFWQLAMQTGQTVEVTHEGSAYSLGPILDPVALIVELQK